MPDSRFFTNHGPFSIEQIANVTACKIIPPSHSSLRDASNILVHDLNSLKNATSHELTFFISTRYIKDYKETKALCCITSEQYMSNAPKHIWLLIAQNPYKAYAETTALFYPHKEVVAEDYIAPSAIINSTAIIGKNCYIGHNVVIEENVEIGSGSYIDAGVVIKRGVIIGDGATIGANSTISHSIIGRNVLILPGVRIGQDGFGFATDHGKHYKITQLGRVIIGDDVEIGASTTIDRGAIVDTIIEDMCRIDNLVQIGHNVHIGKGSIIVAQVGIAGSSRIGAYCTIGGQAGIAGHIEIGEYSQVGGQAGVSKSLNAKSIVSGTPAQPIRDWQMQQIILKNLQVSRSKNIDNKSE